jgi:hypothetical protein
VDGRADRRTVRHFGSARSCPFLPRRDRPSARRAEAGIRDESVIKNKPARAQAAISGPSRSQCSGPGGVLFASWATAAEIRRQVSAPS